MLPETSPRGSEGGNGSAYASSSSAVNKKLTICGLILATIALFASIIVAGTIIPKLEDSNAISSNADAANNNGNGGDSSDDDTTTEAPIIVITPSPTTLAPTTPSPTAHPTTPSPNTLAPSSANANETIYYPYTCECNTSTFGILNPGVTYEVGGISTLNVNGLDAGFFSGWTAVNSPVFDANINIKDVHLSVGDRAIFKHFLDSGVDNVWLVSQSVYDTCDLSDTSNSIQLAVSAELSCPEGSSDDCGYAFVLQNWHVNTYGNTLYFVSSTDYKWFVKQAVLSSAFNATACELGVKVRLFVEDREVLPIVEDDGSGFDFANTDTVQDLQASIGHLSRMLILQQFSTEQRVRSEGYSGLTNVRGLTDGESAYDSGTYTNGGVASIHDHSDNILLIGVGEIQAVLNGVEFQTRHNDYNLNMPSLTSAEYNAVEAVPRPDVPPSVLSAGNVSAQTWEMQEYFRAFKEQNRSHRDYTAYFKPIVCYLEGTWILDNSALSEPFDSDRHTLDAASWAELHDKIRWMSNSGRKNTLENLAHLPSSIRNLYNHTYPIISNWEYRILCHPLSSDVPTSRFRISDDLHVQLMGSPKTREELYFDRRTRFDLNRYIDPNAVEDEAIWSLGRKEWNYLDFLMEQIPGKDNYGANITDALFDNSAPTFPFNGNTGQSPLNAGYYNRFYSLNVDDAMGTTKHKRGWSDRYLFVAKTTQTKVSPIELTYFDSDSNSFVSTDASRYSYAIPLEIIYMTPLSKWNPYNITFFEDRTEFESLNLGRTGQCGSSPFNGSTHNSAYWTPSLFFESITKSSNADTASDNVCALNEIGAEYSVYASGHWITFPNIGNNVGLVRQRYPIFPIHEEGNTAYKEVKAFEDIILTDDYDNPSANPNGFFGNKRDLVYGLELNLQGGGHQHIVYVPGYQVSNLWYDSSTDTYKTSATDLVYVEGDERNSHSHTLTIWRSLDASDNQTWVYHIAQCGFGTFADYNYDIGAALNAMQVDECADNHDNLAR